MATSTPPSRRSHRHRLGHAPRPSACVIANNQAVLTTCRPARPRRPRARPAPPRRRGSPRPRRRVLPRPPGRTTTTTTPSSDPWLMRYVADGQLEQAGVAVRRRHGLPRLAEGPLLALRRVPSRPGLFNVAFQDYLSPSTTSARPRAPTRCVRSCSRSTRARRPSSTRPSTMCRLVTTSPGTTSGSTGTGNDRLMMAGQPGDGEYWPERHRPAARPGTNQCIDRGFPPSSPNGPNTNAGFNER